MPARGSPAAFVAIARLHPGAPIVAPDGLMSYGENSYVTTRRAVTYVDKILKGAKPAALPVEQASQLELVINRRTAKALGIALPQELLLRAEQVIE